MEVAKKIWMDGELVDWAEVSPLVEVDDRAIGSGIPGPVTQRLQNLFFDAVHSRDQGHLDWLTPIHKSADDERRAEAGTGSQDRRIAAE